MNPSGSEWLDIFDENKTLIGVATRDEAHEQGLWHLSAHVWVVTLHKGRPALLFQKRSMAKKVYPGMLDGSCAGHVPSGETSLGTALRELNEEIGIHARAADLRYAGEHIDTSLSQDLVNCEFCETYFYGTDRDPSTFRLQPEEVAGLIAMPLDVGPQLFSGDMERITVPAYHLAEDTVTVQYADFARRPRNYYTRLFLVAERFLRGEHHLGF